MTDINILSHEACEEDLQSEEFQTKTTGKCESRVKNHENEDVDFLPAERIPAYEDKEDFQSTTLPKIEEETLDKEPSPEPEQLLKSSEKGIVDHVVSILDKEPSLVNCKDSDGYTPLHRASYNGHVNVVRILLQRGADVDSKTEDGWQPLHCACRWGKTDVASLLLQNGAEINSQTNGKQTPLHFAASGVGGTTTLKLLLGNRWLDATLLNMQNEAAYDIAKRSGKHHVLFEMVEDSINIK